MSDLVEAYIAALTPSSDGSDLAPCQQQIAAQQLARLVRTDESVAEQVARAVGALCELLQPAVRERASFFT